MKLTMLMVLTVLMMPWPAFADSMLCISEKAVGFEWEQEQWVPKIFSGGSKYILRTATDEDKEKAIKNPVNRLTKGQITHVWTPFGMDFNVSCSSDDTWVRCEDLSVFSYRKESRMFTHENGLGLLTLSPSGVAKYKNLFGGSFKQIPSVVIETGSCSTI